VGPPGKRDKGSEPEVRKETERGSSRTGISHPDHHVLSKKKGGGGGGRGVGESNRGFLERGKKRTSAGPRGKGQLIS